MWRQIENRQRAHGREQEQTQRSDAVDWVGGTFVWTLHDYYGEPGNWPHISSSFGSFDLAGFPKAPVWWYRSWWLAHISSKDPSRPPLLETTTANFCHLVESWQPSVNGSTRELHVYSNLQFATIAVNGIQVGEPVAIHAFGAAHFPRVPYVAGNVTAHCTASPAVGAQPVVSDTKRTWAMEAALTLAIDAPSASTGTGTRVYLDGTDIALIRAAVVDVNGVLVHNSTANITFSVLSGPARVVGVGNGDPADHHPNHVPWKQAYHGLARAVLRVSLMATGSLARRRLIATVNPDAGAGPLSSSVATSNTEMIRNFTLMATSPGLVAAHLTVPLSIDPRDDPLNVAGASVHSADVGH